MKLRRWWRRFGGAIILFAGAFYLLPVVEPSGPLSRMLVDRDGRLLAARVAADEQWRLPAAPALPERYVTALLAFEDRRFYHHPGVDPLAVVRALVANFRSGRTVSGASTITMQVIRLARPASRTWWQKLKEAALALRLDSARTKGQILATYAQYAPFGGNVVGLEAAAWRYFGRSSGSLTWAEAALLAVLPNSPSLMHPGRGRAQLRTKRDRLLERLYRDGRLDDLQLRLAKAEPLPEAPRPMPQLAIHGLAHHPDRAVNPWRPTTLDRQLQAEVESQLRGWLAGLAGDGVHNAAAIVLHVPTGETLAYVGNGADLDATEHAPFVDVARARRSTGSILKPLLYARALDTGLVTPKEKLVDAPVRLGTYFPENFDRQYRGVVAADRALAQSLNVPAVLLLKRVGVAPFRDFLRRSGLSTVDRSAKDYGLSLILGGAEASLEELTALYAAMMFRALGHRAAWPGPRSGVFADRQVDPDVSVGAAYLTFEALEAVTRPGQRRMWRRLANPRRVYWKTGTSFGFRDAWAIGVTPTYAVGVWVGNADGEGRPGLTGLRAAAPVMFGIFDGLPKGPTLAPPLLALQTIEVCRHSGRRPGPHCSARQRVLIPKDSTYDAVCSFCQTITCDADCASRVHADCYPFEQIRTERRFVLPVALERYYRQVNAHYRRLPPTRPGCETGEERAMNVIFPPPDGEFYVPRGLDGQQGRLVFEAAHRHHEAHIHWHLDDRFVTTTRDHHQLEIDPGPGDHVLTLVDHRGARVRRRFRVLAAP